MQGSRYSLKLVFRVIVILGDPSSSMPQINSYKLSKFMFPSIGPIIYVSKDEEQSQNDINPILLKNCINHTVLNWASKPFLSHAEFSSYYCIQKYYIILFLGYAQL